MEEKIDKILNKLSILDELASKVDDLWKFNNMPAYREFPPILHSNSPITINSLGNTILVRYKGKENVDMMQDLLISEIEKRNFKSPLDVQHYSENLIVSNFHSDKFIEIKNLIYHNPTCENQPVSIKTMSLLMGLYLRDKYFEKHPELVA